MPRSTYQTHYSLNILSTCSIVCTFWWPSIFKSHISKQSIVRCQPARLFRFEATLSILHNYIDFVLFSPARSCGWSSKVLSKNCVRWSFLTYLNLAGTREKNQNMVSGITKLKAKWMIHIDLPRLLLLNISIILLKYGCFNATNNKFDFFWMLYFIIPSR